jgi:EH_Signature domain
MKKASDILKIYFSPVSLIKASESAFNKITITTINNNINKLKSITKSVGASNFTYYNEELNSKVFKKFKSFGNVEYTSREIRALAHCLNFTESKLTSIYSNRYELSKALEIIGDDWKDMYIPSLLNCYLNNWKNSNYESSQILHDFLLSKLNSYQGDRKVINSIKENFKYFDLRNGDLKLGNEIALKNLSIKDVMTYLSLPESWVTYPYFENVIVCYFEKKKDKLADILDDVVQILKEHSLNEKGTKLNKRIISKIIIQASKSEFLNLQDQVKDIAFNLIGDPALLGNWSYSKANELEYSEINKAREILNEWITKLFINVFFEACINDQRRKKFWLKMSNHITSFKVFGPKSIKDYLKYDVRISKYVDSRFQTTDSQKQVAAFFMQVRNHNLIEFSDKGYAFYAYKKSNNNSPQIDKKYGTLDSFRNGSMPYLVSRQGYYLQNFNEEGRLSHNDGDMIWEEVFSRWIKEIININV